MNRLEQVNDQFAANKKPFISQETHTFDGKTYPEIVDHHLNVPIKLDYFNKHGWGYKEAGFGYDKAANGIRILGNRYMYSGKILPAFLPWVMENIGADPAHADPAQAEMETDPPVLNHEFLAELGETNFSRRSFKQWERIMHSHGATFQEIFALRYTKFQRFVDVIIYPYTTEHCELMVKLANKHNVVLVPYGGGTNVTQSLMIPDTEKRMVVSVDMSRMNQIKWVDKENNVALVQAGIAGTDLERDLKQYGVCSGHEPDSQEFSTLGGWISTRASGMKKNTYGNIEDIVQNITLVTSKGTYRKLSLWPRISNGPDLNHVIMGSEGNLGIITEAVIKVKPLPQKRLFDSILFPDFETGIRFMHEVSTTKNWPTSIRLVDNSQFQFGATLKPAAASSWEAFIDKAKKFYVLNVKGYDAEKMAACTLLFEGDEAEVVNNHAVIKRIAAKHHGMMGGPENGMRGYILTFLIAYIRDFASEHYVAAESFETSCPWSNVSQLCARVKKRIIDEAAKVGFSADKVWTSFRVTQLYETGAAIYVYFSLQYRGFPKDKIVETYEHVENAARDETMLCGGCISHHHGVGKIRKRFIERTLPDMAIDWQKQIKDALDPNNVFAINNTIPRSEEEKQRLKEN